MLDKSTIEKFDKILTRGLCCGLGHSEGQMCIEQAITVVLNLPFSDRPTKCVTDEIIDFKISLNDKGWSSPENRAKHLRNIGLAQIGSKGIVNGQEFLQKLQIKIIGRLIPDLFRTFGSKGMLVVADICENASTVENAAEIAAKIAYGADLTKKKPQDYYLIMCADLALEVLKDLKSPGCEIL